MFYACFTESAFVAAYHGILRIGRQVLVAMFANRTQFEHKPQIRRGGASLYCLIMKHYQYHFKNIPLTPMSFS
jgi:hypothetical protein